MRKPSRRRHRAGARDSLLAPFESYHELPSFHLPPPTPEERAREMLAMILAPPDPLTEKLFAPPDPLTAKLLTPPPPFVGTISLVVEVEQKAALLEILRHHHDLAVKLPGLVESVEREYREAVRQLAIVEALGCTEFSDRERTENVLYRLAFPAERMSYWEALALARQGNDDQLFNLVRLFAREVEKTEWFLGRETLAECRRETRFFQRYEAARRAPIDWSHHPARQTGRLVLLAYFEPELRGRPPRTIMRVLHAAHAAGLLPARAVPPSLDNLYSYLHRRLGWQQAKHRPPQHHSLKPLPRKQRTQ